MRQGRGQEIPNSNLRSNQCRGIGVCEEFVPLTSFTLARLVFTVLTSVRPYLRYHTLVRQHEASI